MNSRPANPKFSRNKNMLVIGGSGSGKTRFIIKPNLMQCRSTEFPVSFVITDPKGLKCRGQILHLSNTTGGSAICGTDGRTRTGRIFQRFKSLQEHYKKTFFQNEFRFTPEIFLYSRGVNLKLRVLDYSLA